MSHQSTFRNKVKYNNRPVSNKASNFRNKEKLHKKKSTKRSNFQHVIEQDVDDCYCDVYYDIDIDFEDFEDYILKRDKIYVVDSRWDFPSYFHDSKAGVSFYEKHREGGVIIGDTLEELDLVEYRDYDSSRYSYWNGYGHPSCQIAQAFLKFGRLEGRNSSFVQEHVLLDCCLSYCDIPVELRLQIKQFFALPIPLYERAIYNAADMWNDEGESREVCSLLYGHISLWDTSRVTKMDRLFQYQTQFNENIQHWNVSNVIDMECMFHGATTFNQPLNNWDIGKVDVMDAMFAEAKCFNQPLNNWKVGIVDYMFYKCVGFNQPIDCWDLCDCCISEHYMFCYASQVHRIKVPYRNQYQRSATVDLTIDPLIRS